MQRLCIIPRQALGSLHVDECYIYAVHEIGIFDNITKRMMCKWQSATPIVGFTVNGHFLYVVNNINKLLKINN